MTDYFEKRRKQKLYQQWVEQSGLPPEDIPGDIKEEADSYEAADEDDEQIRRGIQRGLTFRLTMRHLLYLLLIIVVLLISTASLATVLIMRSC